VSTPRLAIAFLVAALAMTAAGAAAGAQTSTGTIVGRVVDEQDGALPGATVTVLGKTGLRTQITDARGAFRFVGLDVDIYSIRAELPGFRARQGPLAELGIGKSIELTLDLEVAAIAEHVEVSAGSIAVDTSNVTIDNESLTTRRLPGPDHRRR